MFSRLGKFEIRQLLGQGGMGEVYLGFDPVLGREVAIKAIHPTLAQGADILTRFEREARAAGKLNHPNIVTVHEFGEDQGILYIAMEYVEGQDLGELLRLQALTRSECLETLAQVCDGLHYAHRNGVIHRDIKPSNVRITRDGHRIHAKVMDFGVARISDSEMTATGLVMGTVHYMAPEYIRTGKLDPRSDLFAVGVMLYEALAGRKPFMGDTTPTILYRIIHEPADPIELDIFEGISPATRSVLDRALAKDPEERFQTGDLFARALRSAKDPTWQGEVEQATARLSVTRESLEPTGALHEPAPETRQLSRDAVPPPPAAPRRGGAWRWMVPAGLAAAVGLVLLGVFIARRMDGPRTAASSPAAPAPAPVSAPAPAPVSTPVTPAPAKAVPAAPVPAPPPAAQPTAPVARPVVIFERLNLQADLILDGRERLVIDGRPGDPMRKVLAPAIPVGRHFLYYEVSNVVRYYADIEIKDGDNYVRPAFRYNSLPGLSRNFSYEPGQDNIYTFTQSDNYLTYDAPGTPVTNTGELSLTVKLRKDPKNDKLLLATFAWQVRNRGKELCHGTLEDSNLAGSPRTEGKKVVWTGDGTLYYLRYYIMDDSLQVELSGAFGKSI